MFRSGRHEPRCRTSFASAAPRTRGRSRGRPPVAPRGGRDRRSVLSAIALQVARTGASLRVDRGSRRAARQPHATLFHEPNICNAFVMCDGAGVCAGRHVRRRAAPADVRLPPFLDGTIETWTSSNRAAPMTILFLIRNNSSAETGPRRPARSRAIAAARRPRRTARCRVGSIAWPRARARRQGAASLTSRGARNIHLPTLCRRGGARTRPAVPWMVQERNFLLGWSDRGEFRDQLIA